MKDITSAPKWATPLSKTKAEAAERQRTFGRQQRADAKAAREISGHSRKQHEHTGIGIPAQGEDRTAYMKIYKERSRAAKKARMEEALRHAELTRKRMEENLIIESDAE